MVFLCLLLLFSALRRRFGNLSVLRGPPAPPLPTRALRAGLEGAGAGGGHGVARGAAAGTGQGGGSASTREPAGAERAQVAAVDAVGKEAGRVRNSPADA